MPVVESFLRGAAIVRAAVGRPEVAEQWQAPSVLEEQTVGSLAGHLARGGVWVVAEYLHAEVVPGPLTYTTAGEYFAGFAGRATAADHEAIRRRGADMAATGPEAVVERLESGLDVLRRELPASLPERPIAVISGATMPLGAYLATRIVEQVVHLDDLHRSLGAELVAMDEDLLGVALEVGVDIGRLRFGGPAMVRALYRSTAEPCLPVL